MSDTSLGRGGPHGVRGVLRRRRKVAESLHVHLPLFGDGCVRRCCPNDDPITRCETFVAFGAEFLEGLGIYQFLELGLELFIWGFLDIGTKKN
jgi:hypothetical protein